MNMLVGWCRSFAVKDEIFCLFEGVLDNLGSLRQQYGLGKSANEVVLVIEAYKALRDRAPYPPSHVVGHLSGNFAFIVFDKSTSNLFVASVSSHPLPPTPINYNIYIICRLSLFSVFSYVFSDVVGIGDMIRINLGRCLCHGESQLMGLWPLPMTLNCLKVLVASHSPLSPKVNGSLSLSRHAHY